MVFDPRLPTVLLLHQGGWDEVLMVAGALLVAYLVIVWTGRRAGDDDDLEEIDEGESGGTEAVPDQATRPRS
jgi:hypothetical protein